MRRDPKSTTSFDLGVNLAELFPICLDREAWDLPRHGLKVVDHGRDIKELVGQTRVAFLDDLESRGLDLVGEGLCAQDVVQSCGRFHTETSVEFSVIGRSDLLSDESATGTKNARHLRGAESGVSIGNEVDRVGWYWQGSSLVSKQNLDPEGF
jgi:hypothetical protein